MEDASERRRLALARNHNLLPRPIISFDSDVTGFWPEFHTVLLRVLSNLPHEPFELTYADHRRTLGTLQVFDFVGKILERLAKNLRGGEFAPPARHAYLVQGRRLACNGEPMLT